MKVKSYPIFLVLLLMGVVFPLQMVDSCQKLDLVGETYVLTGDIGAMDICFEIGANGVTLDCAGHTISGPETIFANGVENIGFDGITIKNCIITKFNLGISFFNGADNNLIENSTAISNRYDGFYLIFSSGNTFTGNNANSNHQNGFYLISSPHNIFTNNNATLNSQGGFFLVSSSNNLLTDNAATSNGVDGFYLGTSSSINNFTNNIMSNNEYDTSLQISSDNTLINNSATSNTYGFRLDTSSNNNLTGNTAISNDWCGLYLGSNNEYDPALQTSSNNILTANTAIQNTNRDILLSSHSQLNSGSNICTNLKDEGQTNSVSCVPAEKAVIFLTSSNALLKKYGEDQGLLNRTWEEIWKTKAAFEADGYYVEVADMQLSPNELTGRGLLTESGGINPEQYKKRADECNWVVKNAVERSERLNISRENISILIIGDMDVVPMYRVENPIYGIGLEDEKAYTLTDNPYGDMDGNMLTMEIAVGRIPDGRASGNNSVEGLVKYLGKVQEYHLSHRSGLTNSMGNYSPETCIMAYCKPESIETDRGILGYSEVLKNNIGTFVFNAENIDAQHLIGVATKLTYFFDLHGGEWSSIWAIKQGDKDVPVFAPGDTVMFSGGGIHSKRKLMASKACFGAVTYNKARGGSIAMSAFDNGVYAFTGSTEGAWGGTDRPFTGIGLPIHADIYTETFLDEMFKGKTAGQAMMAGKRRLFTYHEEEKYKSDIQERLAPITESANTEFKARYQLDKETSLEFVLYGDPTFQLETVTCKP